MTMLPPVRNRLLRALAYLDDDFLGLWRPMVGKMFQAHFRGPDGFKANGKEIYRRHYEKVRAMVPKERLLDF